MHMEAKVTQEEANRARLLELEKLPKRTLVEMYGRSLRDGWGIMTGNPKTWRRDELAAAIEWAERAAAKRRQFQEGRA